MTESGRIHDLLAQYFGAAATTGLERQFETRNLRGGDWLFRQGEEGDSLYLLARGRLQAWQEPGEEGGERRLLGEIAPGDSVGEMSLLSDLPRSAGVRAVRDSLLVRIDRSHFDAVAAEHPGLVMKLAANVVGMMQRHGEPSRFRRPRTLAVVPLDQQPDTLSLARQLAASLKIHGSVSCLDESVPARHGAAGDSKSGTGDALPDWLHQQEDQHDFVVFQCTEASGSWAELARRQADLIVFVANAGGDPAQAARAAAGRRKQGYGARRALVLHQPGRDQPISGTDLWLDALAVDFHLHVRADRTGDLERVGRVVTGNAVGLVLSAGAARGFAHIGVYRAMLELGIPVDWIGGSSIGAIMAAGMAADWDLDQLMDTARKSFVLGRPFSDYTMPVTSLISGRRMTRLLHEHLDCQLEDLPIPFFCVSSVLDDGTLNVHERGHTAQALSASAALPGVLPPAVVNRRLSIDGSVLNAMPVDLMLQKPVGRVIAVDLSSQKTYRVDYPAVPAPWRLLAGRYLPFMRRYQVPSLSTIMLKATEIGTLDRMRRAGDQADILLRPDVRNFGITEVKTFDKIVEAGYRCAIVELTAWHTAQGKGSVTARAGG